MCNEVCFCNKFGGLQNIWSSPCTAWFARVLMRFAGKNPASDIPDLNFGLMNRVVLVDSLEIDILPGVFRLGWV